MHDVVFHVGSVWMMLLLGGCIALVVRSRAAIVRIVLLDLLTTVVVGLLALYSVAQGVPYFLEGSLAVAVVSFLGTLAASRFHRRGQVFE